jgi:hypothetical protein
VSAVEPLRFSAPTGPLLTVVDGVRSWRPPPQAGPLLEQVETLVERLAVDGPDRAGVVASVVAILVAEDRGWVLREHRSACHFLVAAAPDLARGLVDALRPCSGSCQARRFWYAVVEHEHGPAAAFPLP